MQTHAQTLPMGFTRQEYWCGLPCPPPGDLPNPGIKPRSPTSQADSLLSEPLRKPKSTGEGSLSISRGNSNSGIIPGSPALCVCVCVCVCICVCVIKLHNLHNDSVINTIMVIILKIRKLTELVKGQVQDSRSYSLLHALTPLPPTPWSLKK